MEAENKRLRAAEAGAEGMEDEVADEELKARVCQLEEELASLRRSETDRRPSIMSGTISGLQRCFEVLQSEKLEASDATESFSLSGGRPEPTSPQAVVPLFRVCPETSFKVSAQAPST